MKNYWTTFKRSPAACWYVTLPSVINVDVEQFLKFAKGILEAGEKEKVFRILQTSGSYPFHAAPNYTYLDYLVETMETTGILPLFSGGGGAASTVYGQNQIYSRISYYDKSGSIVEEEVDNLGLLLENLYPEKVAHNMGYMSHVSPIIISGLTKIDVRNPSSEPVYLSIKLDTDIWFPWVVGFLEDADPPSKLEDMFDNRELAFRHTPRLNQFLFSVYSLVQEFGGDWELAEANDAGTYYEKMCRIDGIELNPIEDE